MKSFTRTTVETFTPRWVKCDFSTYSATWVKVLAKRGDKKNLCFKCEKPFKLGDVIALAAFTGISNQILCQNCAKELLAESASAEKEKK